MKFVHIADMHFDSPFTMLSDKANLGNVRRLEQRQAFKKMIEYIKENNIPYLFISGDLYEQEYIRKETIEYINNLFKEIPETKIFISPGNHDPYIKNSYYNYYNWNSNVTIFNSHIEKVELEQANIYGYGFDDYTCNDCGIEQIEGLDKSKLNILVIHGNIDASKVEERQYNNMSQKMLQEKGFDYIALGHIHKTNYEEKGKIIYPGSTISLGFDELGKHGMIVGDVEKGDIKLEFIPLDPREFVEIELDCSNISTIEDLAQKIKEINLEENKLYKLILTGKRNFEIVLKEIYQFEIAENIIKIKDTTKPNYFLEDLKNNTTLKGIFAQEILQRLEKAKTDEEKEKIEKAMEIGMEVLE